MLRRILGSIRNESDQFLNSNIKIKESYQKLSWNHLEKVIVKCSINPFKAIGFMFLAFLSLFILMQIARPQIYLIASKELPHWKEVINWQTTLLGGQLTIIGIVYPLVVGMLSIIFQKKSARKIVQAAYQVYSGFMLAGLSGLCLSGFILAGVFIRSACSDYTYAVICGISIIWMLLNIALSIWFFLTSLRALDDTERDKMVLRYLTANVFSVILKERVFDYIRSAPVEREIINARDYPNIILKDYDLQGNYTTIFRSTQKPVSVVDIRLSLLRGLLFLVNYLYRKKEEKVSFAFVHPYEVRDEANKVSLFKITGIESDSFLVKLLKLSFHTGSLGSKPIDSTWVVRGMLGESVDGLASGDINAFDESMDNVCRDFTAIADVFSFRNENSQGNLLLLKNEIYWEQSFTQRFYSELHRISRQAVLRTGISERFFSLCMNMPRRIFEYRSEQTFEEVKLGLDYTCYAWEALVSWGKANFSKFDSTQQQAYEELVREFVALWEGWADSLHFKFDNSNDMNLYYAAREAHLCLLPDILTHAVSSGDAETVRHAVDMFNRWLNKPLSQSDYTGSFNWQDFFITPAVFRGDRSCFIENQLGWHLKRNEDIVEQIWSNALTDVRLCTAAFLMNQARERGGEGYQFAVETLLKGSLVEETGGFEKLSMSLSKSSNVIDVIVRILVWGRKSQNPSTGWLSGLVRHLSSAHGKSMISGRVYSGHRLNGLSGLNREFAEILVITFSGDESFSNRIKNSLSMGILSHSAKKHLIGRFNQIKTEIINLDKSFFMDVDKFQESRSGADKLIGEYIKLLQESADEDVFRLPINNDKVLKISKNISSMFAKRIVNIFPFNQFKSLTFDNEITHPSVINYSFKSLKEFYTQGIDHYVVNEGDSILFNILDHLTGTLIGFLGQQKALKDVRVSSLAEILEIVGALPDLKEDDYLVICNQQMCREIDTMLYEQVKTSDVEGLLYHDSNNRLKLRGKKKDCFICKMKLFKNADPFLINSAAFSSFNIKNVSDIGAFNFKVEPDGEDKTKIYLEAKFEYECSIIEPLQISFICADHEEKKTGQSQE